MQFVINHWLLNLAFRDESRFFNLAFRDMVIQSQTRTLDLYKNLWYNTRHQPMKGVLC